VYTNVGGSLTPFSYASLDATAKALFDNRCTALSQCTLMDVGEKAIANSGASLVNYLRGQRGSEGTVFRGRDYVLGDMAGSRPAFVRDPRRSYGDAVTPSYGDFKIAKASRSPVVYIGGNGGMLHAFHGDTGVELWSFVPRAMLPNMYRLADNNYAAGHRYFVDGSPTVQDVYFGGAWHTVLVAGYNAGGRGYFALDVTNPASPSLLWEICSDSSLCSSSEANMGLSFGNPVVTKRASDGKWVALLTSGYNNVSPGDGIGYLYVVDIQNGTVLNRVSTGVGSSTAPSGLARVSAWVREPNTDNTALYVYGGDLEGNIWRFDLSASPPAVLRLATLRDSASKPQPVTTRPELGLIQGHRVIYVGTGRLLGVTDLQDPATLSPAGTWSYRTSMYAIKDGGSALGDLRASGTMIQQTVSDIDAARRTTTKTAVDWSTKNGWFVDLPTTGERINIDPQLVLGTLVFASNIPSTNACTAGGSSWLYQLDFRTGGYVATSTDHASGWLRSSTLTVGNVIVQLSDKSLKNISTGADGTKDVREINTDSTNTTVRRIGWREIQR
jgi:type IV pilus assembly protein PilY1